MKRYLIGAAVVLALLVPVFVAGRARAQSTDCSGVRGNLAQWQACMEDAAALTRNQVYWVGAFLGLEVPQRTNNDLAMWDVMLRLCAETGVTCAPAPILPTPTPAGP